MFGKKPAVTEGRGRVTLAPNDATELLESLLDMNQSEMVALDSMETEMHELQVRLATLRGAKRDAGMLLRQVQHNINAAIKANSNG